MLHLKHVIQQTPSALLETLCLYWVWLSFDLRAFFIFHSMDSTGSWKLFIEILGPAEMTEFLQIFSGADSCCESPVLPHPKGVLLDLDPVTGSGNEEH